MILLLLLFGAFVFLLLISISRKLYMRIQDNQNRKIVNNIKQTIGGFVSGTEPEFREGLEKFAADILGKKKNYRVIVDGYLLEILDQPETEHRNRLIEIAARLGFPAECIAQIRNRNFRISAFGSQRAGLYNVREAVKDMVAALDFFSSENQFEILMGIARMGDSEAMKTAFEKIKNRILVNERGIIEILSAFPGGDKKNELFRSMIHCDTPYVSALFLKATGKEMVKALMKDIVQVLETGNKDVRAAAVRSLATLDKKAPVKILLQALEDKDWEVRALAAKALGPIKTPEVSTALYNALRDQQWWVRQNAATSLASHPGYEALFILTAESGDEYAKDSVLSALEDGGSPVLLRSLKVMTV